MLVTDLARLQRLWFSREIDLYLVPTAEAATLATRRGIAAERVHVTGIPVDLRLSQGQSRAEVRAAHGWDPTLPTVLAVGSRRVHEFTAFLRAVNEAELPVQWVVVTGDDDEPVSYTHLDVYKRQTLDGLPGVGPVLAQRILDWRSEHGRFTSVDELGEVSGIGDKLMSQLRPRVTL